ncbi:MAG TPA: fibronectin type III domain-containing protein [Chitinivibrionales bacterium]|nr:fibronectin type III domain-containing protein [Chitinivibrionales bacterium]
MKKSRILRWSGYGLLAVLLLGVAVFLFLNKTSSSKIVLADEAKEHSIMLHNANGDHACDCFQPWISGVTISNITATSVDVSWTSGSVNGTTDGAGGTYQVPYGTTSAKSSIYPTTQPTVMYNQHTVTVPNLTPGTLYHFGVKGCCLSNCIRGGAPDHCKTVQQSGGTSDWTATTLAQGNTYTISGIIGTTASGKRALAKTATGITGVIVTLSGGASKIDTTKTDGTYTFSGLGLGTYTVTPTKAGITFTPPSKTFTALSANQTAQNFMGVSTGVLNQAGENAVLSNTAAKVTAQEVTITWKTNIPATSSIQYGLTTDYGMFSGLNTEMVYNHDIQLFGLQKGAMYHARAVSYGSNSGEATYSSDLTFKIPATEDRIADSKRILNEPNPAAHWTMFSYFLYQPAKSVTINILTLSGKLVATLESPSSSLSGGWNKVRWDNINLPNGLYAYRMKFQTAANLEEQYLFSSLRIEK